MNFQKPHNNNNSKKMSNMKTQKNTKYQEEDQVFSDDNMGGEEEEVIKGKVAAADAEDKKQKKVVGGKRAASAGAGTGAGGGSGGGSSGGTCQAEKCTVDLSEAKRYHRRHKVCEFHAKAPYVLISGLRQRFCQQCSRFHELTEFDEAKRSCRRRLAGHNERRRKTSEPQGEGGSSSRTKAPAANPQCRSSADQVASRAQMTSHPASTPNFKPFQIK